MKRVANTPKLMTLTAIAIVLTVLSFVMGAPFIRAIRKAYRPWIYWSIGAFVSAIFWLIEAQPLSVLVCSIWMTLGAYTEFEERGFGWKLSGFFGVAFGSFTSFVGFWAVLKRNEITTWERMVQLSKEFLDKLLEVSPGIKVDAEFFAQQVPSVFIVILILSLGIGLIYERRIFSWFKMPWERVATHIKLIEFRVPDFFIWIALTAFLVSILELDSKVVVALGLNIVNIAVVLYFFQGLAVMEVFLDTIRAGLFGRIFAYIILVGQLFFILSLVGLIDYWVDFRSRMKKINAAPENN